MRRTNAPAAPWMPYAPALSIGSPVRTYASSMASETSANSTRVCSSNSATSWKVLCASGRAKSATAEITTCARARSEASISNALPSEPGFSSTASSRTTTVSQPITSRARDAATSGIAHTSAALQRAFSRTYAAALANVRGSIVSSKRDGRTPNSSPSVRNSSLRRGLALASTIPSAFTRANWSIIIGPALRAQRYRQSRRQCRRRCRRRCRRQCRRQSRRQCRRQCRR
mmetsp:Transcript_8376/g.22056  ORF Transcript_8376/g.22056 Transcript_8376/m.22056 type:complete len:229 (-) Transcript_8376:70-756(-)